MSIMSQMKNKGVQYKCYKDSHQFRRTMGEQSENFNKEVENKGKYQLEVPELENTISELENTVEGSTANQIKQKEGPVNWKTGQWNSFNQNGRKKKKD